MMPKFLLKRWHGLHIVWTFILMLMLVAVLFVFQWPIAVVALVFCGVLVYYTLIAEKAFRKDLNHYLGTLSYRVKKAGSKVVQELPIGILLYNEDKTIEWHNPFIGKMLGSESFIGEPLAEVMPDVKNKLDKGEAFDLAFGTEIYQVLPKPDERLLYFRKITEQKQLQTRYEDEKTVIGILMMDNLEEATQGMDDQTRSLLLAKVTGVITEWAQEYRIYIRRSAADRFLLVMNQQSLQLLEQNRFELLDDVRDMTADQKVPFTLSIGIAAGLESLAELGQLAQTSLDMALGRGGDQVAVKVGQRMAFYGGRTSAVEKRTRVRARVISHALRDLIRESDKVIIMGHKLPDMDAIGAAIGMLKMVQLSQKEGYIVLEGINPSIQKLMEAIYEQEKLGRWFITPDQALQVITNRTLSVVLDTHKASLVAEPRLVQGGGRVVIVDHHRRGEEFLSDAVLVYMEPYASSTCELVTELLQYYQEKITMDTIEATSLLAGIAMDTKSFSMRTGARTFEAASFLRRHGADTALIQQLMKEDLNSFIRKAEIIKHAEIIDEHLALAVTKPGQKHTQLQIAQVADTLLNMTDILASFVVSERQDGLIGISARSLGQINVQLIMERLGGGGHLTNAAVQLEGSLEDAVERLKQVIIEFEEKEGLFE